MGNKGIVFGVVIVVISLCCFFYTTSMYDAYRTNKSVMAETSSNTTITIPSGSVVKLSSLYVYQGKMNCVYKNSAGEKFNVKILEKDMDYCGKLDMFWHLYPKKK